MKVAITTHGRRGDSLVDGCLRTASLLAIYNPVGDDWVHFDNVNVPYNAREKTVVEQILDSKAVALITGFIGTRAFKRLSPNGVHVYFAVEMKVIDALTLYRQGELKRLSVANAIDLPLKTYRKYGLGDEYHGNTIPTN